MEFEGFKRCMNFFSSMPCGIGTFVSDRHSSVIKHTREKLSGIKHYFDLWHLKKSMFFIFYVLIFYVFDFHIMSLHHNCCSFLNSLAVFSILYFCEQILQGCYWAKVEDLTHILDNK